MRKPLAKFFLNGKTVSPPKNWREAKVIGNFDGISNTASIESDRYELILDAAQEVFKYVEGNIGIVEGLDFNMSLSNDDYNEVPINGYIDFTDDYERVNAQKALVSVKLTNSISELQERIKGTTVALLEREGAYTSRDYTNIDYVVEKKFSFVETAVLLVTIYLMAKELSEQIYRVSTTITDFAAFVATNPLGAGQVGAVIMQTGRVIAEVAYAAFLAIKIIDLTESLIKLLISPTYTKKAITLRKLIEQAFKYFGYNFESSITQLDEWYYFPSGTDEFSGGNGLPNSTDYGYTVDEIYNLLTDIFYAKSQIVDNTIYFESNNSPFWDKKSSYVLDKIGIEDSEKVKYNISELNNSYFLKFDTDITDEWTIDNYTGTSYEVNVSPKTSTDRKKTMVKGYEETFIPLALGNRKEGLNTLENTISLLVKSANIILKIFGGKIKNPVEGRIGMLKVSNIDFNKAKLLYIKNGKLPSNHREELSAKVLWEDYHNYKSFVENNYGGQKLIYNNVQVPFTFIDYNNLINFNKITDWKGREGEVTRLEWLFDRDTAVIDFEVKEVYTENLKETKIEP